MTKSYPITESYWAIIAFFDYLITNIRKLRLIGLLSLPKIELETVKSLFR